MSANALVLNFIHYFLFHQKDHGKSNDAKPVHKIMKKLTPGGKFIHILCAAFCQ